MWRRLTGLWLLPLAAVVACTGLYLENGNAYPCDFSRGPGARDAVCQQGDVCGSNDVCKKYIYEGPRFEAGTTVTVPEYGPGSSVGKVLHPLILNSRVDFVTRDLIPGGSSFLHTDAGFFELDRLGRLGQLVLPMALSLPMPPELAPFTDARGRRKILVTLPTRLMVADLEDGTALPLPLGVYQSAIVPEVVFSGAGVPRVTATPVVWRADAGLVREQPGGLWAIELLRDVSGDFDHVVSIPTGSAQWLVLQKGDTLELRTLDGGQSPSIVLDPVPPPFPPVASRSAMRTDVGGRLVTVERNGVVSTFQVSATSAGLSLTRAWPDCKPCEGSDGVGLLSPTTGTGTVRVELTCGTGMGLRAVVVTGSVARTQLDRCTTEMIELLPQVRRNTSAEWRSQGGLLLGGSHGELWSGDSVSALKPAYLDRVPLDVAPASAGGVLLTAALTDDYLSVQQAEGQGGLNNGFRRIDSSELRLDEGRLGGFVHGLPNWGVSSEGLLVNLELGAADPARFGPTLVRASGEPITQTLGGEGVALSDGGLLFFLAADDGLYQVTNPELTVRPVEPDVTPDLTPEPSVPIRSLALERTPLSTEGGRGRGYLVTSRNVYEWELSGTPARWSSTPLVLSAGEPLEVWFDSSRSALGRVGFSDGEIYTLPGGFELARALPASDAGVPAQALDYENLGGWPVVYATTGIFVAGWDLVDGKLQNRFPDGGINRPMDWRELTLPDGRRPWMNPSRRAARPGRLYVAVEPRVAADAGGPYAGTQAFRLLLFLDDQVLEIAQHLRK